MKKYIKLIFAILIFSVFTTCTDPVFYIVSTQVAIPEPLIKGSPSNMVQIGSYMYVASNTTIYCYSTSDGQWYSFNPGIGRITYLSYSGSTLYALTKDGIYNGSTGSMPNALTFGGLNSNGNWFLSMFTNGSQVYVGARNQSATEYYVYSYNGTNFTNITLTGTGFTQAEKRPVLRGVAGSYLCIKDDRESGGGIFTTGGALVGDYDKNFMGIINTGRILAITRNGAIFDVTSTLTEVEHRLGRFTDGALLATTGSDRLLLVGRRDSMDDNQSSSYFYGYMEAPLDAAGNITDSFREPGRNPVSTLADGTGDRFRTTLGKYPVKYLFRTTGTNPTFFASTSTKGLWALRDWNATGYPYWNTEH